MYFRLILVNLFAFIMFNSLFSQIQGLSHSFVSNDTVSFQGSGTGKDTATIKIKVIAGEPIRTASLNILLVCDFSSSMRDWDSDHAGIKSHHMRDAVRRFIDNSLKDGDSLAIMKFASGYQMIPEKEREYYYYGGKWIDRAPAGFLPPADSTYAEPTYWVAASQFGPDGKRGHVDSVSFDFSACISTPPKSWTMVCQNSYGIERLWWTFTHTVWVPGSAAQVRTLPGGAQIDTFVVEDGFVSKPGECIAELSEPRLINNSGTSTYYALWHAIRYATTHSRETTPVIIFLTDGQDQTSLESFKTYATNGQFSLPSYFKNFPSNANSDTVQARFKKFISDSIRNSVTLYTIILDSARKPDYSTLFTVSTYGITDTNVQKQHWARARGVDLDSIYNSIGKSIRQKVVRPLPSEPLITEFINKQAGIHLVANSLEPGTSNTLQLTDIQIDSTSGNTVIRFFIDQTNGGFFPTDIFEYQYKVTAYVQPDTNIQSIIVNNATAAPDSTRSRINFLNSSNVEVSRYFNWDTIHVRSQVQNLVLSVRNNALDTTGISSGRSLVYSRGVTAFDTALTLYPMIQVKASSPASSYFPVNAEFKFTPFAWIPPSVSISNSGFSVTPHVVVTFDSSGAHNQTYDLIASYKGDTAQLSYRARLEGSTDYIDSIAIAVGDNLDNRSNAETIRMLDRTALQNPIKLHALGRSHNNGTFTPVNVHWSINGLGFNTYYATLRGAIPSDTVSLAILPVDVDTGISALQTDSGLITIRYDYVIGSQYYSKSFTLKLVIQDETPILVPNAVGLFTADKYTNSPAVLESLYTNYFESLTRIRKSPADTIAPFYALLFCKTGNSVKYLGLDSLADWSVNWPSQALSIKESGKSQFSYTNRYAPRIDSLSVTSSIDVSKTIAVEWSYGNERHLTLEPNRPAENDNVNRTGTPPPVIQAILISPDVASDTVYAVVRDEYGNFVPTDSSIVTWSNPVTSNLAFSGANPHIVTRRQNANAGYSLIAAIPSGTVIEGVTLSAAIGDTVSINMTSMGYDSMIVRIVQGYSVHDTDGNQFSYSADLPSSRVAKCRANAPEDSLPHFMAWVHNRGDVVTQFPSAAWVPVDNAVWQYTNKDPFAPADSGHAAGVPVPVKVIRPRYPVSRDTLLVSWAYGGRTYRDTVQFRVLPGYAASVEATPVTSLTAGDAIAFKIVLLDANNDTVKDPSLFPASLSIKASRSSIAFKGDTLWQNGFNLSTEIPLKFINGVSTDSLLALRSGTDSILISLSIPGLGAQTITRVFTVVPGSPAGIQLVRFNGNDTLDCATDKLVTLPGAGERAEEFYVALVRDAYKNLIQRGDILSATAWSILGDISADTRNFKPTLNTLTYNARGIDSSVEGSIVAKVQGLSDTLHLSIIAPVRVVRISTHEWIAGRESGKGLSADEVLTQVLGLSLSGLDSAGKMDSLRSSGYCDYLDGRLDYLNITLSAPVKLTRNCISDVRAEQGANQDNPATVWKGEITGSKEPIDFYALTPADDKPADSAHSRYRLWLKPSHLFKNIVNKPVNPSCLETGFLPSLTLDNNAIKVLNPSGLSFGTAASLTTDESIVADSAAPVISKIFFLDNSCKESDRRSFVEIYFSEPVGQTSLTKNQIKAFVKRSIAVKSKVDSGFMTNPAIVSDFSEITTSELGESDPRESWNYAPNNGKMMYCRIVLSDSSRSVSELSSGGIEMRLAVSASVQGLQIFDLSMNSGNSQPNRWVPINPAKPLSEIVCRVFQRTEADIKDMPGFGWDPVTNEPLFPFWGVVARNPYNGSDMPAGKFFSLSIFVFDLLGNQVASPDQNPCLNVRIPYETLFATDSVTRLTRNLDFNYLVTQAGLKGTQSPCGILPAWNGLNNKGRIVAPGGYIIKLVADNQMQTREESNLKLILTNKKK